MTITREINGKEIQIKLTDEEMRNAYEEMRRSYLIQDIEGYADMEIDESTLDVIAERAEDIMSKHYLYWECYWDIIGAAIKDVMNK